MRLFGVDRKLGVAKGKHRYDIPLNKDAGAGFLMILIGLMTLLTCGALSGFLLLGKTTSHWESALENKVSIEIPAEKENGEMLSKDDMNSLVSKTQKALTALGSVKSVHIMSDDEVNALVEPWLGSDFVLEDFPLPALLTVELYDGDPESLELVHKRLERVSPLIRLDSHDSWLESVMKLTGSLQFSALLSVILIAAITVVAIAGAIRMRMALHRDDVELLHLMGANDSYITNQFQRHAFLLSTQSSLAGLAIAFLTIMIFQVMIDRGDDPTGAFLHFTMWDFLLIALLPLLICALATWTARHTVLRALTQMP